MKTNQLKKTLSVDWHSGRSNQYELLGQKENSYKT